MAKILFKTADGIEQLQDAPDVDEDSPVVMRFLRYTVGPKADEPPLLGRALGGEARKYLNTGIRSPSGHTIFIEEMKGRTSR